MLALFVMKYAVQILHAIWTCGTHQVYLISVAVCLQTREDYGLLLLYTTRLPFRPVVFGITGTKTVHIYLRNIQCLFPHLCLTYADVDDESVRLELLSASQLETFEHLSCTQHR